MKEITKEYRSPKSEIVKMETIDILTFSFLAFFGEEDPLIGERANAIEATE